MTLAAGIDAARNTWVMALVGTTPDQPSDLRVEPDIAALLDDCRRRGVASVGVDIPIGFAADGARQAERLARARLGRRASTLFPTPAHAVLATDDWPAALAANRRLTGKGISKQVFHLLPRSRQVRAALDPADQPWCSEVHPDSSFNAMNGGVPLDSKHSGTGLQQRMTLVEQHVATDAAGVIARSGAPMVDGLDAYAAAWSAARLAVGRAEILGDGSDPDGYSLTIVI